MNNVSDTATAACDLGTALIAQQEMCAVLLTGFALLTILHSVAGLCTAATPQYVFLQDFVDDLPHAIRDGMCPTSSDEVIVSPDETGVSHYVLPGLIPKRLLGQAGQGWQLVTHADENMDSSNSEAVLMHLWLRAVCIGCVASQTCSSGRQSTSSSCLTQFSLHLMQASDKHTGFWNAAR